MAMADRSRGLLSKVSCGSGMPYVCSGWKCRRMGMADRSRSHLRKVSYKRNALCVVITANGNGRQIMQPPPQSEFQKAERLVCVNNGIAGEWQWQTGHPASSAK